MFTSILYVRIYVDRIVVKNTSGGASAERTASFSHRRAVVGDFTAAQALLKQLVNEVRQGFSLSVQVVIHPMERIEGGLSQIEERALRELAIGAGATRVVVWVGDPLDDSQVAARLKER